MRDLRVMARYLRPCRWDFFVAILLLLVECGFEMAIPLLMTGIIDDGVALGDVPRIWKLGAAMALCAGLALIAGFIYARFAARAAYRFGGGLREAEYEKLQSFAFSNLDRFSSSSLVTRMTTDVTVMQNAINGGLRPMVRGPVMLLLGIGLSFAMNARLALVFVICTPVLGLILALIVRKVSPLYSRQQAAMDRLNSRIQEGLTGIRAIKAFVRGEYEEEKFAAVNDELTATSQKTFHYAVLNLPAFQVTMYTASVLLMWFGGNMVLGGALQVGDLTGVFSYVMQVMNSLMMISNVFLLLTRSLASARRIGEVLDEEIALRAPENGVTEVPDGRVDFENVSFKYREDAKEFALSNVELHIQAGQTVGILGGTGSAKTTLVQLIPRLYDATEGRVLVGGVDVRDYDMEALREQVAMVLQKNVLFSGTIKDNLRWGNKEATDEEMVRVCKLAQADPFIQEFPDKYDTYIEQGGSNVSGGQKQRLCIARALLKKPKILILDDSTSAVDTKTDALIRKAFREEIPETTKFIIAQRISSIEDADKILVMDGGQIVAMGTHEELLKTCDIYRETYESQVKGGSDDEQ